MTQLQKYTVCAFLLIILLVGLSFIPLAVDYNRYLTTTRAWLSMETRLYDNQSTYFYYMPWSLIITIPLSVFPDKWGQAILSLFSLLGIILSMRLLIGKIPWWGTYMAIANLFTFNLLFSGQWDGLVLGSTGLAWWCIERKRPLGLGLALVIMSTKPTNIWLVISLLLLHIMKNWHLRDIVKTLLLPLLALISSIWISGIDWPIRYITYIENYPIPAYANQSIWSHAKIMTVDTWAMILIAFISIVWLAYVTIFNADSINGIGISFALLINLIISPYVMTYHYIGTTPVLGWLSRERWYFAAVVYSLMIVYFLNMANILKSPPYVFYLLTILLFCIFATTGGKIGSIIKKYKESRL